MPSIQQLRYLVALADSRHFRRAAEACHVTQPTLSAQLKELETRLGAPLVERGRGGVILTATGAAITERARQVLRDIDEIRAIAAADRGFLQSTIRIGVVQTLGPYLLPLVIPDLHASHPKLGLYVREGLPATLLQSLEAGALDLLLFPLPVRRGDLDSRPLFREPIHVVVPQDHRLAGQDSLEAEDLRGETVLALEPGHRLYEQVRGLCERYGAALSHDYAGTSLDTLRQMVAMGMGISLLPALYVKSEVAHQDIVVARPFRSRPPARSIGMVWRRGTARDAEYRALGDQIATILRHRAPEVSVLI
jgi:LysR family hydrogen peroxide-inducible transcriptional activator